MMKAAQNRREKYFRKLSKGLKHDWEEVATHCGIPHVEIEKIKAINEPLQGKSFQFLVKLPEKFPSLDDWSGKLLEALSLAERMDLFGELQNFISEEKKIQDTMAEGSLDSEPSLTSSSCQKGLPGDSSVPENSKRSENEGILKTASQNGNAKPEGSAATKMSPKRKRKLSKDAEENSSPKIKKGKTLKKIVPVEPPPGELKQIKDINLQYSSKWYIEAWLDRWATEDSDTGPVKSKTKRVFYYSHCFLRDKSEEKIFTAIFCKYKKDCMSVWRKINGSSEEKRLYLRLLDVEKEKAEFLDKPGQSNYCLKLNEHSKVTKAFEVMKVDE